MAGSAAAEDMQDDLRDAYHAVAGDDTRETEKPSAPDSPTPGGPFPGGPARDEQGRFASPEPEPAPLDAESQAAEPPTTEPALSDAERPSPEGLDVNKPPSSWSPTVRETWDNLPENVRREVLRREEASASGVRKLQEEFAPIRQFAEGLAPYLSEYSAAGVHPAAQVQAILSSERQLRHPDPQVKFQALLGIADSYGIPLREVVNGQLGAAALAPVQTQATSTIHPQVEQELQAMRQWREQSMAHQLQADIEQFAGQAEFFNDVRGIMGELMTAGQAQTLQDAYDKAVWQHPEVRDVLIQRRMANGKDTLSSRQAAAAGASVRARGQLTEPRAENDDDDIRTTIGNAYREAQGRL